MKQKESLTERDIAAVWQRQELNGEKLLAEDGRPLEIIHPGRLNSGGGPDFKDAVIRAGCEMIKGDIEIHLAPEDWFRHGHHLDAAYNGVILHIVMQGGGMPARLQNGGSPPVLTLSRRIPLKINGERSPVPPCRKSTLPAETLAKLLDNAGEERFLGKSNRFKKAIAQSGAGQALYEGIMTALGYSRNKLPFQELARRAHLEILEKDAAAYPEEAYCARIQGLLMSASGLSAAPHSGYSLSLAKPIPKESWHLDGVRPHNSPLVRLAAISRLLARCREKGLLDTLLGTVEQAPPGHEGAEILESTLVIRENDVTLLGRERAADIAVNVLLPFTHIWGHLNKESNLRDKAIELYRDYPRLSANVVEREMKWRLGLNNKTVSSARRQQGLIHIYRNLCCQDRCEECCQANFKPGTTSKSRPSVLPD